MIELYHHDMSVCAQKVRMVLAEKGIDWTSRYTDLLKGESRTPEYLKLNPNGVVPTLVHDGTPIIESTVINEYLDDTFPDVSLRPADSMARARMRLWTRKLDDGLHFDTGTLTACIAFRYRRLHWPKAELEAYFNAKPPSPKLDRSRENLLKGIESSYFPDAISRVQKALADMETSLEEGPWLAGKDFSLADIGFLPYILRYDHLCLAPLWDDKPRLADWYARIQERPSYAPAIAEWLNDGDLALMVEKGAESWPRIAAMAKEAA